MKKQEILKLGMYAFLISISARDQIIVKSKRYHRNIKDDYRFFLNDENSSQIKDV